MVSGRGLCAGPDLAATFAELASKNSDCSSAKHGGDLGAFGRCAIANFVGFEGRPPAGDCCRRMPDF